MSDTTMARIGHNGRFVIPSEIRKALDLKDGDQVRIGIDDGKIVILPPQSLLEEFYSLTQNVRASSEDVVQALIDERREEASEE